MVLQDGEIARRENGQVLIRPAGVRVRWEMRDLTSSDGHTIRASFSATVRPLPDAAERRMLEEAFLGRKGNITAADVAAFFAARLESAARRHCAAAEIQTILAESGRAALLSALTDAGAAVAFGCGMELLPPMELELDSPTLRATQEESRRSTSQVERFGRAAELFKKFQLLRAAAPELGADKILNQLGGAPAEQAEVLRCLLMTHASQSAGRPLWAVAGPHLIRVEPDGAEPRQTARTTLLTPPGLLGPFRSVQQGEVDGKRVLLLGARSGVLVVDPANPQEGAAYADSTIASSLGFNAMAVAGARLWATHGEAGLVAWDLNAPDQAVLSIRQNTTPLSPRNLLVIDANRLVFSSEHRLFELSADGSLREVDGAMAAPIVAIISESPEHVLIIHEDGELHRRDRAELKIVSSARRTGKLTAAGALPWLGGVRLLLATEAGPVLSMGMDDELVGQYVSNHTGLRQTAAAADRVAAVSADRQRILLWPSWDGRGPATEVHIAALAKHRVADIEC